MTLSELIDILNRLPSNTVFMNGLESPHSWRGSYSEICFEPSHCEMPIKGIISTLEEGIGSTYEGWKGGEFTMNENTNVHVDYKGSYSGDDTAASWLSKNLLNLLLNEI